MKIIGIGGSLRKGSYSYQGLKFAFDFLKAKGLDAEIIDLRELNLPFCNGSKVYVDYPDVQKFRKKVQEAQGILLATPEYHGSLSGVLKNALDLLEEEDVRGKIVALMSIVGGAHSGNAINTLRIICRQLHCWVLPEQVIIANAEENFRDNQIVNKETSQRLEKMMDHFEQAVKRFS